MTGASALPVQTPGLSSYLKSIKSYPVETSVDHLVALLKRRQICSSRPCAIATARLLLRVVASSKAPNVEKLIAHVQNVGKKLIYAQPREMAVGNIVRRVLGLIRDEAEEDREGEMSLYSSEVGSEGLSQSTHNLDEKVTTKRTVVPTSISGFRPLWHGGVAESGDIGWNGGDGNDTGYSTPTDHGELQFTRPPLISHTSYSINTAAPMATSMFSLLSHPQSSPTDTPSGSQSPVGMHALTTKNVANLTSLKEIKAEVVDGIGEIIDELGQVDDLIAANALEHIHSNEIILTQGSSVTVQKFLLKAAAKRKFTVIVAEAYPNNHVQTYKTVTGSWDTNNEDEIPHEAFQKSLSAAGITVILISDAEIFALMSRVNKVILGTHIVLANGGLIAASGAKTIARAAKFHRTPVVVVTGVYKLSPVYPFDFESLIEYGDASKVIPYEDGDLVDSVDVENPLYDYVPADLVDLYITNIGGHAPSYLYRIVLDHYRVEDVNLA